MWVVGRYRGIVDRCSQLLGSVCATRSSSRRRLRVRVVALRLVVRIEVGAWC